VRFIFDNFKQYLDITVTSLNKINYIAFPKYDTETSSCEQKSKSILILSIPEITSVEILNSVTSTKKSWVAS
jgi:hypothetical protein